MEKNKKARSILRTSFTKNHKKIDELMQAEEKNLVQIKALMELIEKKRDELIEVDAKIYDELLTTDVDEQILEEEIGWLPLRWLRNLKWLQQEIVLSVQEKKNYKMKLPKIEFRNFSGELKEWLPFWAQFKKIHEDETIDEADKFQYLIQASVSGSKARNLVESFPATGENYSKAVQCLKERYGRDDLLIEFYIRELLGLIIQNTVSNEKMSLPVLYDKLECQLRALQTLQITTEKCASMLMPLVESCLPEEILRTWQRNNSYSRYELNKREGVHVSSQNGNLSQGEDNPKFRLERLMSFLRIELENEQKIKLALAGFGVENVASQNEDNKQDKNLNIPTAASLLSGAGSIICVFCEKTHNNSECFQAQKMTIKERLDILNKKRCCFNCLKTGHRVANCKNRMSCFICGNKHNFIICSNLSKLNNKSDTKFETGDKTQSDQVLTSVTASCKIMLQTLLIKLIKNGRERIVRAIIDTGSQRSYLTKNIVFEMNFKPIRKERIRHALFGGTNTEVVEHGIFEVQVSDVGGKYNCKLELLEQLTICGRIDPITPGPWLKELVENKIEISDLDDRPIEVLIGADFAGELFTGRKQQLLCGLVAIETHLGWTVLGRMHKIKEETNVAMLVTNMLVKECNISDFWALDVLGITDPSERKRKQEIQLEAEKHFNKTVTIDDKGRYLVHLPWLEDHPPLPNNYQIAEKRLTTLVRKLKIENYFEEYDAVFQEWVKDGIIEEVMNKDVKIPTHYLPHRHVIKLNSTTKIRPVFDASAKALNCPSINDCLTKGLNLIELIPTILNRFRMHKIGIIADIKKAFLQISIFPGNRDFLRFLWQDPQGNIHIFRHRRVVFGLTCSPFLLNSVIHYHLNKILIGSTNNENKYSMTVIGKLIKSFYVDNCVTSLENKQEVEKFINEATSAMAEGQFELRAWEYSQDGEADEEKLTNVLGMMWNKSDDTLRINVDNLETAFSGEKKITKRKILSATHRIFDPIGVVCPVLLLPKILLQKMWHDKIGWDDEVNEEIRKSFLKWQSSLTLLNQIKIKRWLWGTNEPAKYSLQVFCDASQMAYSAVVFLRTETLTKVNVQLIQAKSRIAPVGKENNRMTIPRLELLAACIGVRLFKSLKENLDLNIEQTIFWTDSTTVLAWINRDDKWDIFVRNRVKEIRDYTSVTQWRYVSSANNPADLPSRGCSAVKLVESQWWEGPSWLKELRNGMSFEINNYNEEEINQEKKKTVVSSVMLQTEENIDWYYRYFSSYNRILRLIGWILRFKRNSTLAKEERLKSELTIEELNEAEIKIFQLVQNESFSGVNDAKLSTLQPFRSEDNLIRIKTKISNGNFAADFCYPIVLPGREHPVVKRLIFEIHRQKTHATVQTMITILRKRFSIIGARRTIRSVLNTCIPCKRHTAKRINVESPALPLDRIRETQVFEVIGIDLAGPLYMTSDERNHQKKAWICLFTCAVYRAVHLELISSPSTDHFIQCLRKFISRRGRPSVIYSDNGTNFKGASNALDRLNWDKINKYGVTMKIKWKFNPPTAAWWGGWWERLIGLLKQLLRRQLGNTSLDFEEMQTILCECESVINSRPLTYVSEDPSDLTPITPEMFLKEIEQVGVIDLDEIELLDFNKRLRYRNQLRHSLKQRFQEEYLSQLTLHSKKFLSSYKLKIGDVVLVENDNLKRIEWPLAKIVELLPDKEGETRLVRLKTANGTMLRPVQRLYPLEINFNCNDVAIDDENNDKCEVIEPSRNVLQEVIVKCTRSGRQVKPPIKLDL